MRLTDIAIERNFLYNIGSAEARLQRLQDQASSGKLFQRPQDDPVGVQRSIHLKHQLAETVQYLRNLDGARTWMEHVEVGLGQVTAALQRVSELAIGAVTATTPRDAREAIIMEINEIINEIDSIEALRIEDRQVLSGTMPTWRVGDGVSISANDQAALFAEIRTNLNELGTLLGADPFDGDAVMVTMEKLTLSGDRVLAERAKNGAKIHRLEALDSRLQGLDIDFQRMISDVEDVDLTEVLVKLKSAEASYHAALGAGARLIQPTLLDYLR
jgi:flagellar hook-associated protein 3 FlgL